MPQIPDSSQPECESKDLNLICCLPSGRLYLEKFQLLRGYCIFRSAPVVVSINDLDESRRANFLNEMVLVGDAILSVTGAYRMNYLLAGNFDPVLHAHIVPRYLTEPDEFRKGLPWLYPNLEGAETQFDYQRDYPLMQEIAREVELRLTRLR